MPSDCDMAPQDPNAVEVDQQTLRAIMELQLKDMEDLAIRAKGKQKEGTTTDAQLALQIYIEDLHACDSTLANRHVAQSVANAMVTEVPAILEAWRREEQIALDHNLARRLSKLTRRPRPRIVQPERRVRFQDTSNPRPIPVATTSGTTAVEESLPSPIPSALSCTPTPRPVCVACTEEKQLVVQAQCKEKHQYCRACIVKLFELASRDESLFPAKCDGMEIPLDSVRPFLALDLLRRYETRNAEIRASNRTYCHNKFCGSFLPATVISHERRVCQVCGATTCAVCKGAAHNDDCPEDTNLQQLQQMARKKRWQRCYACKNYIQLDTGCNHISCRCGAQFCYVCGAKWKTCRCEFWDERHLLQRQRASADGLADPSSTGIGQHISSGSGNPREIRRSVRHAGGIEQASERVSVGRSSWYLPWRNGMQLWTSQAVQAVVEPGPRQPFMEYTADNRNGQEAEAPSARCIVM